MTRFQKIDQKKAQAVQSGVFVIDDRSVRWNGSTIEQGKLTTNASATAGRAER